MASHPPDHLVRPLVRALDAYVPGEQPQRGRLIKLNTNENPYPPSLKVIAATRDAVDGRLRLYPDPSAARLRMRLAKHHGCDPANIIVGNGSDELLAVAVRAFAEPASSVSASRQSAATVQYLTPSYSLYPTLAESHGARRNEVPLEADFTLPLPAALRRGRKWDFGAALTFVTTPNAPSGRGYSQEELEYLCSAMEGVVVLDEAYVDFASGNALALALSQPHVLVARTFSKGYSLCFQRVGYVVGHRELIAALAKLRDSYSVNGLGQVAALATLDDLPYYRANVKRIIKTRTRLTGELGALGFEVLPSETNFLLVRPPAPEAATWFTELRARKILVRYFEGSSLSDRLRITVGTDEEVDTLLRAVRAILRSGPSRSR
ncbi:MAG: histidinol-phosphate transaminase [Actinomycetia bacterium]|nr:histidinol-phosphate transaminase [Actinomycetes bacterium]